MPAPAEQGRTLLALARAAVHEKLGVLYFYSGSQDAEWLKAPAATFVTLNHQGKLRGCMGSLEAKRPLGEDVKFNARAAAFQDPRFKPLQPAELEETEIEISLLSEMERMTFAAKADAIRQLRPGTDGVVFTCETRRSTFLPQVWQQLPDPVAFLEALVAKAGFAREFWPQTGVELYRYTVTQWSESEFQRP